MTAPDKTAPGVPAETSDHPAQGHGLTRSQRRNMILRACFGVGFEYYDYAVFAIFAPFFASQFFVSGDSTANVLNTLLVFALGFVMRPLGAMIAGRLADRIGRKPLMMVGLALSAAGSLAIAVTPTYNSIGIAAVVILLVARLAQGGGHGVESISAYTYVAEVADPKHRAFQTSAYQVMLTLGLVQASLLGVILTSLFTDGQMHSWAWRIPFFLGALYGLFIVLMRRKLPEPVTFENSKVQAAQEDKGYWRNVWTHRRTIGILFLLWPGMALGYYTFAVGYPAYAITSVGANANTAFWAGLIAQVLYVISVPLWTKLSDAKGRRFNYTLAFGGTALLAIPLQLLLGPSFWSLVVPMTVGLVLFGCASSTELAMNNELVPNKVRAQVMSIPSSIGAVVFGGTAPFLRSWAEVNLNTWWFTGYVIVLALIALVTARMIKEPRGRDLSK
ncbi:MFS transporter [Micrococcaceae bacterium Sec5.1]